MSLGSRRHRLCTLSFSPSGGLGKRAWNSAFSSGMGKRKWNSGFSGQHFLKRKTDTQETGIRSEVPVELCYIYHCENNEKNER